MVTGLRSNRGSDWESKIRRAMKELSVKLRVISPLTMDISEYNQRYLKDKLENLESELAKDTHIIKNVLRHCEKPAADIILLDYGGGTGFLSLLAKQLGIGTVIYNDIYDVSCRDAQRIAESLGLRADHYVEGDIDALVKFCGENATKADAIVSYDVLEHIYDIEDFLRKMPLLCCNRAAIMHSSGANIFFYPTVRSLRKTHIESENVSRQKKWGHRERDCLTAFYKARAEIIAKSAHDLKTDEIECLACHTRGLRLDDIIKAVNKYKKTGKLPVLIDDPTNTCDPYTGNWAERLINPYYLQKLLLDSGFKVTVLPGRWGKHRTLRGKIFVNLINPIISVLPKRLGLYLSPFYSLFGQYQHTE